MSEVNNKYSKGKIYKIICKTDHDLIYIGSTIKTLKQRWYQHKYNAKKCPESYFYKTVDNDWDNFEIILIEKYPCGSKNELEKKERFFIDKIGIRNLLNTTIPTRTGKEYINTEEYKIKKYHYNVEYVNQNKEKVGEYFKTYYQNNKKYKQEYDKIRRQNIKKVDHFLKCKNIKIIKNALTLFKN